MRSLLASRHLFWILPTLLALLHSTFWDLGWLVDDHIHRAALTRHPDLPHLHRTPGELFNFVDGQPESIQQILDRGDWPWWSSPELKLAFWRPVTGYTHALDYRLWPNEPFWMHVHSTVWFVGAVALLLMLYRRILPTPTIAGLAAFLWALDDTQSIPALWLANRNLMVSVFFSIACLWAHDRWRRDGWRPGAWLGPLALALAVLANEGAVAVGGYLVAYTLFVDPALEQKRWLALIPSTLVGVAWMLLYRAQGFGARGSAIYIDPSSEPLRFLDAAAERAPVLLWGWWGLPPADLYNLLPAGAHGPFLAMIVVLTGGLAWLLRSVLRQHPVARFLALGMVLAVVPLCSTFPSSRLLAYVGIGGAGVLALALHSLWQVSRNGDVRRRVAAGAVLVFAFLVHGVVPPLLLGPTLGMMQAVDRSMERMAASLETVGVEGQEVMVVATPSAFLSLGAGSIYALGEAPMPARLRVMASGLESVELERLDAQTLVVRPEGGFLRTAADPAPQGGAHPADPRQRGLLMLDSLFRDFSTHPFAAGERLSLAGLEVEIVEVEAGRPTAVAFRTQDALDSPGRRWLAWGPGGYQDVTLPPIGGKVTLPAYY